LLVVLHSASKCCSVFFHFFLFDLSQVLLLESRRFFPSQDCGRWRVLPADRASRDKRFLLQNMFSNHYLGHDPKGRTICDVSRATPIEHLDLEVDESTGLLRVVFPHWHWERGAPLVVRGEGKRNTNLWPEETKYLEELAKLKDTENPPRSLRCGYGGRDNPSCRGYQPALLQVKWDLPLRSRRPPSGHTGLGGLGHGVHVDAAHAANTSSVDLNWLGQRATDFSHVLHANASPSHPGEISDSGVKVHPRGSNDDPVWLSPHRARTRGLLP
jgi:hypothetical protein